MKTDMTEHFRHYTRQCLLDFNRVVARNVFAIVDNHIVPELAEGTDIVDIAKVATKLLRDAAAEMAWEVPLDKKCLHARLVARFKQHLNGECDDEIPVAAILKKLRVEKCGDEDWQVIAA